MSTDKPAAARGERRRTEPTSSSPGRCTTTRLMRCQKADVATTLALAEPVAPKDTAVAEPVALEVVGADGQNNQPRAASSNAGASVRQASSVTARQIAIAGPLSRNLPKSAKNIIARPRIVVAALPT